MMAMSTAISIAARAQEKTLILMHLPVLSPDQPVQKESIGVHWKMMTRVLAVPNNMTKTIKMIEPLCSRADVWAKTRR